MRITALVLTAAFAFAPALAGKTILTSQDVLTRPYNSLVSDGDLVRRQDDQVDSGNSDGGNGISLETWEAETNAACQSTLSALTRVSSPSGMSVCFNIPSLSTENGTFEADLRLYRVSPPRGSWADVDPRDVNVNVAFANARVNSVAEREISGMGLVGDLVTRQENSDNSTNLPEQVQSYMLIGRINDANMTGNLSISTFEQLLMPVMSLSAAAGSENITSALSPSEAAFVSGVFSDMAPMSSFSAAQAAVDEQIRQLDEGDIAFILPGTQILIFPIGLVITGSWTLLGILAYGFGTVERWRFRESYRQRVKGMGGRAGGI